MLQSLKTYFSEKTSLHTPLLAIFWVLYGYNEMADSTNLVELSKVLFVILLSVIAVMCVIYFCSNKHYIRNQIYFSFFLLITLFGENIITTLEILPYSKIWVKAMYLYPLFFLFYLGFMVKSYHKKLFTLNYFINLLMIIYCTWEVFVLIKTEQHKTEIVSKTTQIKPCENCADIYFILVDAYTNSTSLQKYWNYDNTPFLDSMKKQGFFHSKNAKSDYNKTVQTLSSMLNMKKLPENLEGEFRNRREQAALFESINYNEVTKLLTAKGYELLNLSLFRVADIKPTFTHNQQILYTSLPGFLFSKSFYYKIIMPLLKKIDLRTYNSSHIFETTNTLKTHIQKPHNRPQFAYLHLLCPHEPYLFDSTGYIGKKAEKVAEKTAYLNQIKFINKHLIDIVKYIQTKGNPNAIILISGDHGFRKLEKEPEKTIESYTTTTLFYFPKQNYQNLHDSMTSVELFKAVLKEAL
jgi:hypothetical protein